MNEGGDVVRFVRVKNIKLVRPNCSSVILDPALFCAKCDFQKSRVFGQKAAVNKSKTAQYVRKRKLNHLAYFSPK